MNFKILKNKDYTLLILGQFVSAIGTLMQNFALSLYILKQTGSGLQFASVLAIGLVPKLILGPICGVFADWFDRKKIIVYMDLLSGFIIGILYIISISVELQISHIYATVIIFSIISSIFSPAISAAIPSIVKKDQLVEANSFSSILMSTGRLIAPMLAGLLYGTLGLPIVLLINSISFIISAISEMFIKIPKVEKKKEKLSYRMFKKDFSEGVRYIKNRKLLLKLLICSFVINFTFNPVFSVGFTYIAKMVLKITDAQFGLLQTIFVVSGFVGPILAVRILKKIELSKIFFIGLMICSALILAISISSTNMYLSLFNSNLVPFITLICLTVLILVVTSIINISMSTINQREVPIELFGRVSAVWSTVAMATIPLGQIIFGYLFDRLPAYLPVFITAVTLFLTAIAFMLSLRKKVENTPVQGETVSS